MVARALGTLDGPGGTFLSRLGFPRTLSRYWVRSVTVGASLNGKPRGLKRYY